MVEEPDRIRDDIELTRAQLAHDVDRLADKTVPSRVAQRGWATTKAKVRGVTDRVMGSAHESGSAMKDRADSLKDTAGTAKDTVAGKASDVAQQVQGKAADVAQQVQQAPAVVRRQAQGNPVAAGLIAFGAGMLAASLLPATEIEKRAGRQVREHADELVEPVKQPLREAVQDLGDTAKEAVASVRDTAKDAARTTADTAKDAAAGAKDHVSASTGH